MGLELKEKNNMKYRSFPPFLCERLTSLPIVLFFLFLIDFLSVSCTYIYHTCSESLTFTDGSIYSRNLHLVINDLFQNAPQSSGFNTSSHGQSSNQVYGLVQCTGNITAVTCSNCVREANTTIRELCPKDRGGKIWLDDCFLRYGGSNFFSILDTDGDSVSNGENIGSDINAFQSTIKTLLSDLFNKAYVPANKGFAAGSANYSSSGKLYGLVQCWRDISIQDCRKCFTQARPQLEYSTKQGAQVRYGSCMARYEVYSFYSSAQSPSHSPEEINPLPPTAKSMSSSSTYSNFFLLGCWVLFIGIFSGMRNSF